jgi:hypothetical protein
MEAHSGVESGNSVNWNKDASTLVSATTDFYTMTVARLEWMMCGRPYAGGGNMTSISVSVQGTNTQNIDIFLVFKNFKSVVQIHNLTSGAVPQGEPVTFIAMALNQNNQYVLHKEDFTISANKQITLDMKPISETDLVNMINGL